MFRVVNLLRQPEEASGTCFALDTRSNDINNSYPSKLNSMAEEPPPTVAQEEEEGEEEEGKDQQDVPSSSSRDWLQLGLATPLSTPIGRRQVLTELELFGDRPSSSSSSAAPTTMQHGLTHRRQMPWGGSSPTEMIGGSSWMPRPTTPEFVVTQYARPPESSVAVQARTGIRVVSPPRRQTGVWCILQAAQNQGREPLLPQIPKNCLRIKNGSMTVRLLIRYLVNKLGLGDESEVEITCRDQLLLPSWTLQYVRDSIWCSGNPPAMLPYSPSIDHVMTLQYRRRALTSSSFH